MTANEESIKLRIRSFKSHGWDQNTTEEVIVGAPVLADCDRSADNGNDMVRECARGLVVDRSAYLVC